MQAAQGAVPLGAPATASRLAVPPRPGSVTRLIVTAYVKIRELDRVRYAVGVPRPRGTLGARSSARSPPARTVTRASERDVRDDCTPLYTQLIRSALRTAPGRRARHDEHDARTAH